MNRQLRKSDFVGSPLKLVAVPEPGDRTTYAQLADIELSAYALWRAIQTYRDTPALPGNAEYRQNRMEAVKTSVADMRKALGDG